MNHGRIDPHLRELFSKIGPSSVQSSHGVAASLSDDSAREILRELPAVGPVTYLSSLEVIVADVEKDGFDFLVDTPDVHAISDAEHLHELPEPLDIEKKMNRTSRDVMRGDSEMFDGYEGKGITVAVLDSGIHREHECFGGRVSEQISCVSGSTYDGDKDGHGTHVAGSIGGERFGSATEASIVDLRVFGYNFGRTTGASTATLLQALDLCIQKEVDIINMSLGGGRHRVLDTAVDTAVQSGMIACVAAGNSGPRPGSIESPSSAQLAISVAATHGNGRVTSFSSRGPNPWYSWQKPDVAAFGSNVLSASNFGGTRVMSGTSMATPSLAGIIACLLEYESENPDAKAYVEALIRESGQMLGQTVHDVGHGFVTLESVESYLSEGQGMTSLRGRKSKFTKPNFYNEKVVKCEKCNENRVVHRIFHRPDGTMRIRMSCIKHRTFDKKGNLVFDEVEMENWKHARITDRQFLQSLRFCGGCGRRGLVPISSEDIELPDGHHKHTAVKVGCLYCNAKGERRIPNRLAEAWR